jgi:hypothetical protein
MGICCPNGIAETFPESTLPPIPNTTQRRKGLLTGSGRRIIIRKAVHDDREQGPREEHVICKRAEASEPEGAVADGIAAAVEERDHGDGVGDVEEDDAGCDHAGKRTGVSA